MHAVGRPVRYTALATASGFAVLLFMNIIPVRVFGGLVAFGTLALRLLSFSFIPAMFALSNEKNLERASLGGTSLAYVVADAGRDEFIKTPEAMRTIEALQRNLEKLRAVGKTFSVVDYVKRINRVLPHDDPTYDRVPDWEEAIAQSLFLFSSSAKPSDLDNVVDPAFRGANIWVQ